MNRYLVLTNNISVIKVLNSKKYDIIFEEELIKVLEKALDYINTGYKLIVDPLAGYISRYNPFHTLILEKVDNLSKYECKDLEKIDILMSRYWLNKEIYNENGNELRKRKDHLAVDASIAFNVINNLVEI